MDHIYGERSIAPSSCSYDHDIHTAQELIGITIVSFLAATTQLTFTIEIATY